MRIGGPIFKKDIKTFEELIKSHKDCGFGAMYQQEFIADSIKREEFKAAIREADIVLAEAGAYCINILDTDRNIQQKNIDMICTRLEQADEMGANCCVMHGGSIETGGWGKAHPENLSEKNFIRSVEIIQGIIDAVTPEHTKLVLETESYLFPDSPQNYKRFLDAVDRKEFAVHLDPVNITCTPRRVYYNDQFIKECFSILGPWIISCHAKDFTMAPIYPTVKIDETYVGDGILNYQVYIKEILNLPNHQPTLMIEHLNQEQLISALKKLFDTADELGITFEGSDKRIPFDKIETCGEYFAPHQE